MEGATAYQVASYCSTMFRCDMIERERLAGGPEGQSAPELSTWIQRPPEEAAAVLWDLRTLRGMASASPSERG